MRLRHLHSIGRRLSLSVNLEPDSKHVAAFAIISSVMWKCKARRLEIWSFKRPKLWSSEDSSRALVRAEATASEIQEAQRINGIRTL